MQLVSLLLGRVRSPPDRDGAANWKTEHAVTLEEQPLLGHSRHLQWASEAWAANPHGSSPLAPVLSAAHWLPASVTPSHSPANKEFPFSADTGLSLFSGWFAFRVKRAAAVRAAAESRVGVAVCHVTLILPWAQLTVFLLWLTERLRSRGIPLFLTHFLKRSFNNRKCHISLQQRSICAKVIYNHKAESNRSLTAKQLHKLGDIIHWNPRQLSLLNNKSCGIIISKVSKKSYKIKCMKKIIFLGASAFFSAQEKVWEDRHFPLGKETEIDKGSSNLCHMSVPQRKKHLCYPYNYKNAD